MQWLNIHYNVSQFIDKVVIIPTTQCNRVRMPHYYNELLKFIDFSQLLHLEYKIIRNHELVDISQQNFYREFTTNKFVVFLTYN